jgi:hypothetical protein
LAKDAGVWKVGVVESKAYADGDKVNELAKI